MVNCSATACSTMPACPDGVYVAYDSAVMSASAVAGATAGLPYAAASQPNAELVICRLPVPRTCVAGAVTMEVEDALTAEEKAGGTILACQAKSSADCAVDA